VYLPLIGLGSVLARLGRPAAVPLYETYRGKSLRRIEQDVYDRFFTRIEQRHSRAEIEARLGPLFETVTISPCLPYWHFLCERPIAGVFATAPAPAQSSRPCRV
jgi:hypothetical protein